MRQTDFGRRARWVALLSALSLFGCRDAPIVAKKPPSAPPPIAHMVEVQQVDDPKAVIATVRSKKVVEARVRTPGTVVSLRVAEGAHVEAGQILGVVADPKIALRLKASDAQIAGLELRVATAKAELDRVTDLQKKGIAPQSRLDQTKTAFDLATNELVAVRSERAVIEKQAEEGQVLAPSAGRILRVPVTEGSVVLAGESIATVAASEYLLRLEVPERHARSMRKGDRIKVGEGASAPISRRFSRAASSRSTRRYSRAASSPTRRSTASVTSSSASASWPGSPAAGATP